jgi:hypothetical protein
MKKLLLALLLLTGMLSCKQHNVWTKSYEKEVYNMAYDTLGTIIKDSAQRRQLALYMVREFKKALPYGLTSVSADSLTRLSAKIGREYSDTHDGQQMQAAVPWSAGTEASLRASIIGHMVRPDLSIDQKNHFCDCVVVQLKKIYPDSLKTPLPDSVIDRVVLPCKYLLKKR